MHLFRLVFAVISVVILVSCGQDIKFVYLDGAVWNTTYSIKFKGEDCLADSVQYVLRDVEMSLSPFNSMSVISRINSNESMSVDQNIESVFALSQHVSRVSHGAFDPTLSPLINMWGFGYTGREKAVPTDSMIDAALSQVGIDSCFIMNGVMKKKSPCTTFNFSAVTKGYGCDRVAAMLRRNGVTDYMIEIGGEIALSGHNDRRRLWRVMVDAPVDSLSGHTGLTTVELTDCGIATSGNYRNYRRISSGKIGHTISAVTGLPVQNGMLSATVIAPDCATADALATACMAMSPDSALAMIDRYPAAECLLVTVFVDSMSVYRSQEFPL